ncbi:MAG: roadblock/LC7 domain-containing protein [Candidatus Lokiarchaeota archaeon]
MTKTSFFYFLCKIFSNRFDIRTFYSEVSNSALVSLNGQMMSSALHKDIDDKAIGAMSAALVSVSNRVGDTLRSGTTGSVVISGSERLIILNQLSKAVLIALAPSDAKIGLIELDFFRLEL